MTASSTSERCVACRGPLVFFGTRGRYTYARCGACSSIQLDPLPTPDELTRAYSEDYSSAGHYGTDPGEIYSNGLPFFRAVVAALRGAGVSSGPVLDVGCGWGGMVRVLRDEGYDPLGVDYESESLEYCRSLSLPVETMALDRLAREGRKFAAITLVTVFEHLVDHRDLLDRLAALLDPSGVLVILVPTAGVFGAVAGLVRTLRRTREIPSVNGTFEPPWHTTIFSVEGVERMLDRTAFSLESVKASPSGSGRGLKRAIQGTATALAFGDRLLGRRWPLVLNHIFVCRRRPDSSPS